MNTPALEVTNLHKRFGGVQALQGASFTCLPGEVHALVGGNGSGKSTLTKCVTGVVRPDAGTVRLRGEEVTIQGPKDAVRRGIGAVYQELSLVPDFTALENIVLGAEPARAGMLRLRTMRREVEALLERHWSEGTDLLDQPVRLLAPALRQMLEVMKAVYRNPDILIFDEATASLRQREVETLFNLLAALKAEGKALIFVSHRMDELYAACDRATVLRNGETVGTAELAVTKERELVTMMVGQQLRDLYTRRPQEHELGAVRLRLHNLRSPVLEGVSLELRSGEVVGLGGLQGQGQSELLLSLFGAAPYRGYVEIDGQEVSLASPSAAIRNGVVLVPGDRKRQGLLLQRPVLENISLPALLQRRGLRPFHPPRERGDAARMVEALSIKVGALSDPVSSLSGGNQQKIVAGKWLLTQPKVLLLDDPTKGVDVHAKKELYDVMQGLTGEGVCILLNSSDDQELLALCDRILVMVEGKIVATLEGEERTEQALLEASLQVETTEEVLA